MAGWRRKLVVVVAATAAIVALVWIVSPDAEPPGAGVEGSGAARAASRPPRERPDAPGVAPGTSAPRGPARPTPSVEEPEPGTLGGRVLDAEGTPLGGVRLAIVSPDGIIDETTTAPDGTYVMVDDALAGTRLAVASEERDLVPLMAGEQRELDLVIGDTREVVGWVLDLAGEPVPGVRVTLRGEQTETAWSAWTDGGGGFRFAHAPGTVVRVTADGGELGLSSARLAQSRSATRREVTLVLEPTATIIVHAPTTIQGEVLVRALDPGAHGGDGLDDFVNDEPSRRYGSELEMMELVTTALRGFDPARPADSLTAMALHMVDIDPSIEREMRRDAMRMDPNLAGAPRERIVRAAVDKVMREEPQVVEMMSRAAAHVKAGKSGMEAFMAAAQEVDNDAHEMPARYEDYEPTAVDIAAPPELTEEPAIDLEEEAIDVGEEAVDPEDLGADPYPEPEPEPELIDEAHTLEPPEEAVPDEHEQARIKRETGASFVQLDGERRSVVARGALGSEIPVRAALAYEVVVRLPSAYEIVCGSVLANAGQVIEMQCGRAARAIIVGRVVDAGGRPLAGMSVEDVGGELPMSTTTDARGRFELGGDVERAWTTTIQILNPRSDLERTTRHRVSLIPGGRTDLGTIVLRRPEEGPDMSLDKPFGGVGAALERQEHGVVMSNIAPESPLGMEGVEDGATLVSVDDVDAMTLPIEDAIMLLRGDVGTDVALRLRSMEGELYDVLVRRGLIDPRATPHVVPDHDEIVDEPYWTPPLE